MNPMSDREFAKRLLEANPVRKVAVEIEVKPEPALADVTALLERQAETCERIAKTLGEIAETVKGP